jgi:hypothetical protein
MRIASLIPLALALLAVLFVILIGRAYDREISSQLKCVADDPNVCAVTP